MSRFVAISAENDGAISVLGTEEEVVAALADAGFLNFELFEHVGSYSPEPTKLVKTSPTKEGN